MPLNLPDTGEPFGLPSGTVRGLIAFALTGTLIQQVVTGSIDAVAFIGIAGPFLGYYVAQRGTESAVRAAAEGSYSTEPLDPPATGVEDPA